MFVHRSSSLEELVDKLAEVLSERSLSVLQKETILIQSAGMERYLSRELARRSGILANVEFPFPRSFLRRVLDLALGEDERASAFERENLTWAIFLQLSTELVSLPSFQAVQSYLEGDNDHSRRLLLSERLAYLFDQYVTYRPHMVLGWESGKDSDDFQAVLWRKLVEHLGSAHFASRCQRFMNELTDEQLLSVLPPRMTLMGGPGLPPLFLEMLAFIGKRIPCHLFSFSVCGEYFADAHPLHDPLPEVGEGLHPLLVSLGKVGADYQHLLEVIGDYEEGSAAFRVPEPTTVLSALQRSLVQGQRELDDAAEVRERLLSGAKEDHSITLDSCHSPLREVEVLHDRLLTWFKEDPTLRPEDVVVLAPNIEEYSPLISAVFAARAGERPRIPFRIADRSEKYTNAAARAFLLALSLLRSRFKASQVLDLLQLLPVRARYQIESADLEKVTRWVTEAQIRWGVDGEHKARYGLPLDDGNTWRSGLRRLFLGYALFDEGEQLWNGTVPLDQMTPGDIDLAGRLADFCEGLFALRERLESAPESGLSPEQWREFLSDLLGILVSEETTGGWDETAVRSAIHEVTGRALLVNQTFDLTAEEAPRLGLRGIEHLLMTELDASRPSTDFLAGGVTFCALLPLRTIPFRSICVLGLNQSDFPRSDAHYQLDRMAGSPKRGDRSLRADDRYLFLEVISAARERLSLSYVGRSVQDNTEKPPSVVVSELSQVIEELLLGLGNERKAGESKYLTARQHPLQPFHPDYFRADRPELVSFDEQAFAGAEALIEEPEDVVPFFGRAELPAPSREEDDARITELTLDQLVRFWKAPTSAFLRARGVVISDEILEVEDREPILETGLSRFIVGDRVLSQMARGGTIRADVELARGDLPVGQGGRVLLDQVKDVAEEIHAASSAYRTAPQDPPVSVNLSFGADEGDVDELAAGLGLSPVPRAPFILTGSLDQIHGEARVETSYGMLTASRKLGLWIRHLALSVAWPERSVRSVLVVRGSPKESEGVEIFELVPLRAAEARRHLATLCRLALLGLTRPLPFFPVTSEAYFQALLTPPNKLSEDEVIPYAFSEARRRLFPDRGAFRPDPAVLEVYRGTDPLGDLDTRGMPAVHPSDLGELPFARLAETLYQPMHRAEQTGGAR